MRLSLEGLASVCLYGMTLIRIANRGLTVLRSILILRLLLNARCVPYYIRLLVLDVSRLDLLATFLNGITNLNIRIISDLVGDDGISVLTVRLLARYLRLLLLLGRLLLRILSNLLRLITLRETIDRLLLRLNGRLLILLRTDDSRLRVLLRFLSLNNALTVLRRRRTILDLVSLIRAVLGLVRDARRVVRFTVLLHGSTIRQV